MKCEHLQLQMSHPRLREVKGLAQGHTAVTGHTRILTAKLMLRGSLPPMCQRAKILHTVGGFGLPLVGPKSVASFPRPPPRPRRRTFAEDQNTKRERPSGQLPSGGALGLCAQAREEGVQEPELFRTRPGRQ